MEYIGGLYGIISTLYYKIDHYKYVKKILSSQEMFMISKYSYGLCNSREQFWEEIENKKETEKEIEKEYEEIEKDIKEMSQLENKLMDDLNKIDKEDLF